MATGTYLEASHFKVIFNLLSESTNAEPFVKAVDVQAVLKRYKTEILEHACPPDVTLDQLRGSPTCLVMSCRFYFVQFFQGHERNT
jgi:hypothetical protein